MSHRCAIIVMVAMLLAVSIGVGGSVAAHPAFQDETTLRVVTKSFPPFVIMQNGQLAGFSIELWDAIANQLGVSYEWIIVETVVDQLEAVQSGEADVAIAGITITEAREELVDFSFPYFDSGLQILVREEESSPLMNTVRAILSPALLQFLAVFFLLILVIAHVIWLVERHKPDFPDGYREGIAYALWWSTVTVIGYDDRTPRSGWGRLVAILWMFAGIFLIANLTATLSAGATVRELRSDIRGVSDLQGQQVATVEGTTSANFLRTNGIGFTGVTVIQEAYDLLLDGQVDAVVYDSPVLRYYVLNSRREDLDVVGPMLEIEKYGIALSEGSPYREPINRATLKLLEDGTYRQLYQRWFGSDTN
jgi:ABC-type amino acid transport substrate-binding protein